jgi:hypothetical protein
MHRRNTFYVMQRTMQSNNVVYLSADYEAARWHALVRNDVLDFALKAAYDLLGEGDSDTFPTFEYDPAYRRFLNDYCAAKGITPVLLTVEVPLVALLEEPRRRKLLEGRATSNDEFIVPELLLEWVRKVEYLDDRDSGLLDSVPLSV